MLGRILCSHASQKIKAELLGKVPLFLLFFFETIATNRISSHVLSHLLSTTNSVIE